MIPIRCWSSLLLAGSVLAQTPSPVPVGAAKPPAPLDAKVETALAGRPGVVLPQATARPGHQPPALPLLPTEVLHDVDRDGVHWAMGRNWKASFDGASFTYVPRLSPTAARSWPLSLRLASVTSGTEALPVPAGPLQADARRLQVARGGCVERFDLRPDGVEQSWLFAQLPSRGELRLQLAVATDLVGIDRGDDLVWNGPDGGVHYGGAVAIDARGRRCELALDLRAGQIELVVPAAFVAAAELPLLVDPLTSTIAIDSSTLFRGNSDLAFDYTTQEFLIVWQSQFSATDMDVFAQRMDLNQTPIGTPFAIDFTGVSWTQPKVANNGNWDTFLVVAECSNQFNPPRWVGGRIWSLAGGNQPQFDIERQGTGGSFSGSCYRPDVGGDAAETGGTWFCVVWEREFSTTDHDIVMRLVGPFGALQTSAPTAIDTGGGYESFPRIAKSNGYSLTTALSGQYWPIVYQRTFSPVDEDVRGSLIGPNGQFVGSQNFPVATSSLDERAPVVSSPTEILGGRRRHAVAFLRTEPLTSNDVLVSMFDDAGALLTTGNLQTLEGAGFAAAWPQVTPAIDCDGYRFAIAYGEIYGGSGGDYDVRVSTVGYDHTGNQLVVNEARAAVATSSNYEAEPALASAWSGGGGPVQYGMTLQSFVPATNVGTVLATVYRGHRSGPLPSYRATACGPLAITVTDLPALGRVLSFAQSDNGPLSGFVIGTPASVPLPFCPGCTVGADGPLVGNPLGLYVPLDLSLVGLSLSCQAWSAYSGTCLGAIALSDTIDFTIL
ncbi:MAG: hypothetical protein MUC36_04595 [Planctomycetes bacterium]|jgi:hypothetical protein|nr:hypothetical protein [Planctomycetota bacterium]